MTDTLIAATGQERYYAGKDYVYGDYYVEHLLSAEVHELDRVGAVITAARSAGATRVAGIVWWVSDEETYREQAARAAVQRAFARARTLADAAGATLGRVVRLGTPEALAATLGAADAGGGRHEMITSALAAPPGTGEDAEMDEDPLILPVPITIEAVVHGAWAVTAGG
ncbi:MAG TPA: SIMPL domain-containing protein [Gemmatimonadaceae bacterium]|nr:SIMPL domain-containing protein [Gemmatimonadaceae bacterium]